MHQLLKNINLDLYQVKLIPSFPTVNLQELSILLDSARPRRKDRPEMLKGKTKLHKT